jgi:hypothetical protein
MLLLTILIAIHVIIGIFSYLKSSDNSSFRTFSAIFWPVPLAIGLSFAIAIFVIVQYCKLVPDDPDNAFKHSPQ